MAINLQTKMNDKIVDRFKRKAYSTLFTNDSVNFLGAGVVEVITPVNPTLNDYTPSGSNRFGTPDELQDTKQVLTMSQRKAITFTIDKSITTQQGKLKKANERLSKAVNELWVPARDLYVFAKLGAAAVANSMTATAAITNENAFEKLLDGQTKLSNKFVPMDGRAVAVSPSFYNLLKRDNSFIKSSDMGQGIVQKGVVGTIDGMQVVVVPESLLPTNCAFIIAHNSVCTAPITLETYRILNEAPGIDGALCEAHWDHDAFVLDAVKDGVYMHLTA